MFALGILWLMTAQSYPEWTVANPAGKRRQGISAIKSLFPKATVHYVFLKKLHTATPPCSHFRGYLQRVCRLVLVKTLAETGT